jgi:hypothetical protein
MWRIAHPLQAMQAQKGLGELRLLDFLTYMWHTSITYIKMRKVKLNIKYEGGKDLEGVGLGANIRLKYILKKLDVMLCTAFLFQWDPV